MEIFVKSKCKLKSVSRAELTSIAVDIDIDIVDIKEYRMKSCQNANNNNFL